MDSALERLKKFNKQVLEQKKKFKCNKSAFVTIDEVLYHYPTLEAARSVCGVTELSFRNCIDYELKLIGDPVASLLFTRTEGLVIKTYDSYKNTYIKQEVRKHSPED